MANIKITRTQNSRIGTVDWNNLGFGVYFSDHMFIAEYKNNQWNEGEIMPYGPLPMEPGLCTLHYGQSIFEGLKAFRNVSGGMNIFRPDMNAKRLNHSGSRVCIPAYDIKNNIEAIIELVKVDRDWIPQQRGHSLYIRPVIFGSSNFLGVHSSSEYLLIIMTSPVASYYPEGLNPVKIMVASEYVRAVRGGLGSAKTAANYAASLLASAKAKEQGYAQVLWLDAVTRNFVDEVGAMNIMFVIDNELITPPLVQGTILAGVTRDTVLTLAREWGMKVSERALEIAEVFEANEKGKLQEIFGTGTAAIISPVGQLAYKDKNIIINESKIGPIAQKMYDTITGIQYGEIEDKHGWNIHVDL
ncbi:MAG: branched chain amino acid aminotransferase [Ignavibacteria bacterium GWB2_35_12]|nr:MAG: branched chain amino acid aminotransferase [Ignavibacteria bacterium GWB2_35_12]OGU86335.1 MAG: branched chain amino acid aminotransferase [Ignavibacteria bacterium RIFOXYA2_FULL_35_10]OGV20101.1 MAG: branched chain amino acid aminotransferase [Ignavibacteria bacterium RIFOXYC2_FULL_35_21]